MRDLSDYAFSNARIRAMYSQFLRPEQWEILLHSRDVADAVANLHDTYYSSFIREDIVHNNGLEFIERELTRHDLEIHHKILDDMHIKGRSRKVISLLCERYELEEIKAVLRNWHARQRPGARRHILSEAIVHLVDIARVMAARNIGELAGAFDGTHYQHAILLASRKYHDTGSLFYIESALDQDHFKRLWEAVDRLSAQDRAVASRLVGIEVDIENICWLLRLRQYYDFSSADLGMIMLPRGYRIDERTMRMYFLKDGLGDMVRGLAVSPYQDLATLFSREMDRSSLSIMEDALYQSLLREALRAMSGFPFTIGTIMAYLILKRAETRKLTCLLYGKSYGLKPDAIKGVMP